jgi:DNA-binding transcriptional ArsR family regulator
MNPYLPSAKILKALAHPARLRLLYSLRDGEECVCHLTALLGRRQAYVSQHLMFLRRAGLLEDRQDGLRVYYRLKDPRVLELVDAVNSLWGQKDDTTEPPTLAGCPCPKCSSEHDQQKKNSRRKRC